MLVLRLMKIESLKQLSAEGTDGRTEIATSWAPVGVKKGIHLKIENK